MVAYVVPADVGVDVDTLDLKRHLSENLPRYMLPAGVMVLGELPKTVNGKLDDSALPQWTPGRSEHESLEIDDCTARVIEIVADVTGFVGQILPSDDFINDLGGTSLGIVRVLVELEQYTDRRMQMSDALADTSVAGLASLLRGDSVSGPADFAFNTDGDAPPLFLLHAYLGGMLRLRRLAELLPSDQPVYGLQVHSTSEQVSDSLTLSSLASDALNRIRAIQPTGRITVGGCSAGGLIVFETARKLLEEGDPEPRVLMFDAVLPHSTFDHYWGEWVLNWRENWRYSVNKYIELLRPVRWRSAQDDEAENDDLLALAKKYQLSTSILVKRYKAQMYNGDITVMRTRQGRMMALGRKDLGWSSVTKGTLRIIDVPGAHLSMFEVPHVSFLAQSVNDWLSNE